MKRRSVEKDDCIRVVRACGSPLFLRRKDFYKFYECPSPDFTGCAVEDELKAVMAWGPGFDTALCQDSVVAQGVVSLGTEAA
jgi:hypothetical protein